MSPPAAEPDRRKVRTRQAILDAMRRLVFSRRYSAIRTGDLIEAAGVGKSTFYEHFRGKDEVLVALVDPLFSPLADAAAGRGNLYSVEAVLGHLWEQRGPVRCLFEPPLGPRMMRRLAAMTAERIQDPSAVAPAALAAAGAAAGTLEVLRAWLAGAAPCAAADLARHLVRPGAARPTSACPS